MRYLGTRNFLSVSIFLLGLLFYSGNSCSACTGYSGPGGPCYTGPGGGLYTGPGGGAYSGPGGPCSSGPGAARYDKWGRPSPHCK